MHMERVFARHADHNSRMQIARVRVAAKRLVGRCEYFVPVSLVFNLVVSCPRVDLNFPSLRSQVSSFPVCVWRT